MLQSAYTPVPVATQSRIGASTSRNATAAALTPTDILLDLDVPNRRAALRAVSAVIERSQRLSAPPVFRALWRREKAGSTGVGEGLGIPHARIAGITNPVTVYVRLKAPVDFAAPDSKRVSDLFVILVPADGDNAMHLQLLSLVAEAFSDSRFRLRLGAATNPRDIQRVFSEWISDGQLDAPETSSNVRPAPAASCRPIPFGLRQTR